jgi:hypothetical protein
MKLAKNFVWYSSSEASICFVLDPGPLPPLGMVVGDGQAGVQAWAYAYVLKYKLPLVYVVWPPSRPQPIALTYKWVYFFQSCLSVCLRYLCFEESWMTNYVFFSFFLCIWNGHRIVCINTWRELLALIQYNVVLILRSRRTSWFAKLVLDTAALFNVSNAYLRLAPGKFFGCCDYVAYFKSSYLF